MVDKLTNPPEGDARRDGVARERALAELAERQYGVVGAKQLARLGIGRAAIDARLRAGRLHPVHRGVYAVGYSRLSQRGRWQAAVLACGEGAVLSHASAAALWGLIRPRGPVDVASSHGRPGRLGIRLHRVKLHPDERTAQDRIPVTSVARTLLDLADVVEEQRLERAFEEADRLGLLRICELEQVCARGQGRRGLRVVRRLIASSVLVMPTASPLEDRFVAFCRSHDLPPPTTNVIVEGREVDAIWPSRRLIVELDGFEFHRHRAAFERDRARDTALQAAGYRVIRLTHRRLEQDRHAVITELRRMLRIATPGGPR